MKYLQQAVASLVVLSMIFTPTHCYGAEGTRPVPAVGMPSSTSPYVMPGSRPFTHISPNQALSGEFIHGSTQDKILIRIHLLGAIAQQGIHYVPEGTDLLDTILYAGGYGDNTKLNGIMIRRRGVKEVIEIDLEDLIHDGKELPRLVDGDIVTIAFSWRRDIATISLITGFITSMTAFTVSLVALLRTKS